MNLNILKLLDHRQELIKNLAHFSAAQLHIGDARHDRILIQSVRNCDRDFIHLLALGLASLSGFFSGLDGSLHLVAQGAGLLLALNLVGGVDGVLNAVAGHLVADFEQLGLGQCQLSGKGSPFQRFACVRVAILCSIIELLDTGTGRIIKGLGKLGI